MTDTISGVERLSYTAARAGRLGWSVDTVGVIGDAMGAEEYTFGGIGPDQVAGLPDGGLVVLDGEAARVLEYGPDRRHRSTYGRRGKGPGELSMGAGVALGPAGDTIWVNDLLNRRLTAYPRSGGEPASVAWSRGDVFPGSRIAVLEDGFLQVVGAIGSGMEAIPEPLVRLDRAWVPADTLWEAPREPIDLVQLEVDGRSIMLGMPQEFWPDFHWRAFPDGAVVLADSADYVLRIFGPDGTLRRIVRRQPAPRPTTDADREAAKAAVVREAEEGEGAKPGGPDRSSAVRLAQERVEKMTFAERIPRIVDLQVDPRGRIWVGVSEETPGEVERIDLYDGEGVLLGETRSLPFPATFAGADRLITIRRDELNVPQVVVLEVDESG